jgi:hypothetical protein
MIKRAFVSLLAIASLAATLVVTVAPAAAQEDIRRERVRFAAGSSGATIRDSLRGYETVDYVLSAREGQTMRVTLSSSNPSTYFNILPPDGSEALFNGSIDGNSYDEDLDDSGDYVIRVYLMRNAARRNEAARYRLDVSIVSPVAALPDPLPDDFADSLSGGPDFWEVTGVARGDMLNLRRAPSAQSRVIATFANGEFLRNLGCRIEKGQRWCQVEPIDEPGLRGWVAGRFLREGNP